MSEADTYAAGYRKAQNDAALLFRTLAYEQAQAEMLNRARALESGSAEAVTRAFAYAAKKPPQFS